MHISAKDKNTGKENKITIKSNSGLSDEEIQAMIRDAEANAESDKKARTLIETRNSAEAQVHAVKKDLEEHGDKITSEQKAEIESVVTAVEEAVKGDDVEKINEELNKVYPAMKALLDAKSAAEQPPQEQAGQQAEDNVVDATFTEKKAD